MTFADGDITPEYIRFHTYKAATQLQEIIDLANALCDKLESAAEQEKKYCYDVCHKLETLSLDTHKIKNSINLIKTDMGV